MKRTIKKNKDVLMDYHQLMNVINSLDQYVTPPDKYTTNKKGGIYETEEEAKKYVDINDDNDYVLRVGQPAQRELRSATLPIKDIYDKLLYKDIGGLEGLKKAREKAGLQTSLAKEWYEKNDYESTDAVMESAFDVLLNNDNWTQTIFPTENNPPYGGMRTPDGIKINFNQVRKRGGDELEDIFFHEMNHEIQAKDAGLFEQILSAPGYINDAINMAIDPSDKNLQQYVRHVHEAQSFINGAMHHYQNRFNKMLITPEDFNNFYDYNKAYFEKLGLPKSHILKIAPTLVKNDTEKDLMEMLG